MTASDYDISPWRFPVFSYGLEMASLYGRPATLPNYRLDFNWLPSGAVTTLANIKPTPFGSVDGIYADLTARQFKAFDAEQGRDRKLVRITVDGAHVVAWAHFTTDITRYRAPSPSYVTALLAAASLANVSDDYLMNVTAAAHQLWLGRRQHNHLQMIRLAGEPSMN